MPEKIRGLGKRTRNIIKKAASLFRRHKPKTDKASRLDPIEQKRLDEGLREAARLSVRKPLTAGQRSEKIKEIKRLLKAGADPNPNSFNGRTALMWTACDNDTVKASALMLEHGADVDARDDQGQTALYYAIWQNSIENAKLLLEHGADANAQDSSKQSLIVAAISYSNEDMVKLLLDNGANVDIRNERGRKVLWFAASFMKKQEIANLLISKLTKQEARKLMGEKSADAFLSSFRECIGE